ncbi:MAG TPA: methionine--tRNA ligase [Chloroflexi bacterium]|nr:methionine--tRNA ligase [Chloroflexota bacterium]
MTENILVCTAWPYANGDQHVGHMAGSLIPADIFARYHRLKGNRVLMVSGSDAHGTPITVKADAEGVSPRDIFERYHQRFLDTFISIGISYDLFTHTDTENHYRVAQDIFAACLNNGYIYKAAQQQFYSAAQRRFLPDRYIEGTCPKCGYDSARGDQCDNCKTLLEPTELINPHAKEDSSTLELRETEHFFLDLAALKDEIAAYLNEGKDFWRPNVINFSRNYVKDLRGRPITRDINWGIPIPLEGYDSKRLYVWFEAVIGYLSASIEWAVKEGEPEKWKDWWYQPQAKTIYFMGKDNIPFHSIIWPGELIATGRSLYNDNPEQKMNLPYNVASNEYLTMTGSKISTSRNFAIWTLDILERFDPDAVRYYLNAVAPETRDTDFTFEDFITRNNNELVATWGNLVNRMLGFAYKRFDAQVPQPGELDELDREIIAKIETGFNEAGQLIEAVKLKAAQQAVMKLAQAANVYLDRKEPWKVFKNDKEAAATTVYVILRVIDSLKILFSPFLPFTGQQLHQYLGYSGKLFGQSCKEECSEGERSHSVLRYRAENVVGRWKASQLPAGQTLQKPATLFKKLDEELAEAELSRLLGDSS